MLKKVKEIISKEKIEILFVGVDFELTHFAKYKNDIKEEANCVVVVSEESTIEIADDKYLTYQFLKEKSKILWCDVMVTQFFFEIVRVSDLGKY